MKSVSKIGNISVEVAAIGLELNISDIETTIEVDTVEEYTAIIDKKHEHAKEIVAEIKTIVDKVVDGLDAILSDDEDDAMDIPEFMKQGSHPLQGLFAQFAADEEQEPTHPLEALLKQINEGGQHKHDIGIPLGAILGGLSGIESKGISLADLFKQIQDEQEGNGPQGFNPFGGKGPFGI